MERGKGSAGFTLIELAVTIVIISILALIGGGSYRRYVRRAMAAEGVTFARSIATAEDIYHHKNGVYFETEGSKNDDNVEICTTLGINSGGLKYFKKWRACCCNNGTFKYDIFVIGSGEGEKLQVRMHKTIRPAPLVVEITDNENKP